MSQGEQWEEARRGLGLRLALLLSLVLWARLFVEIGQTNADLGVVCLLLGAGLILPALGLAHRPGVTATGLAQVLVTLAVVLGYRSLSGSDDALLFLAVPALLGVCLAPTWATAAVVVGAGSLPAVLAEGPLTVSPASLALATASLGGMAVLAGAWWRGLLWEAWGQSAEGAALARQVRLRQEEVNRLNKALRLSNGLLKRSLNELALAQREAQEAKHLKEQFATTVSHELRTPLNIILGFVEVMQRYPEVYAGAVWTPALRRDVTEIQRSARYLSELIDDVLDLARLQALKMPVRREYCDLGTIVSQAVDLASRLLTDKREVRLVERVPDGLPPLFVDRTRVR